MQSPFLLRSCFAAGNVEKNEGGYTLQRDDEVAVIESSKPAYVTNKENVRLLAIIHMLSRCSEPESTDDVRARAGM